jgi:N-methylhydantoinase B/oxoprolinase/acetone carboxylase alpha subunit
MRLSKYLQNKIQKVEPFFMSILSGRPSEIYKINTKSSMKKDLPTIATMILTPDERLVSEAPGGDGFGNPLERVPEIVRLRAREGWISLQRARDVYGIVLDTSTEQYTIDYQETKNLRERLIKEARE